MHIIIKDPINIIILFNNRLVSKGRLESIAWTSVENLLIILPILVF